MGSGPFSPRLSGNVRVVPFENSRERIDLVLTLSEGMRLARIAHHLRFTPKKAQAIVKLFAVKNWHARIGLAVQYQSGRMALGDKTHRRKLPAHPARRGGIHQIVTVYWSLLRYRLCNVSNEAVLWEFRPEMNR